MKLFFVYWTDTYSDWKHYGVFSTQEKADSFIENHELEEWEKRKQFHVEEFELDTPGGAER